MTLPSCGFSLAVSGMMMPPFLTSFLERLHEDAIPEGLDFHFSWYVCVVVCLVLVFNVNPGLAMGGAGTGC